MGGLDPAAVERARAAARRRRQRAASGHVLAAFRRVGASRKLGPPTWDPTRAQRTGTRLHGSMRHGQRAAAFDARTAEAQAAAWAALQALADPMAHKRIGALPAGVTSLADYRGRAG